MQKNFCLGTRFWGEKKDEVKLLRLAARATKWNAPLIIATDDGANAGQLIYRAHEYDGLYTVDPDYIHIIEMSPWINFVIPLNLTLHQASSLKLDVIVFISLEIDCELAVIESVVSHIDDNTLVAGAALPGHDFGEGQKLEATGTETPWNTFAAWNLEKLSRIGFTLAGDALWNRDSKGVEEVTTISLFQHLFSPEGYRAKLLEINEIEWQVDFADNPERRDRHVKKMARKRERPAEQLKMINLPHPCVQHTSLIS